MADSLFDDRYRYDYIYPRGRSGETLRAVDTKDDDRPVVIKRPAPNDAPPIRAGQEVSILNERKALMRLVGQPALTALLGTGQFYAGGVPHQYIVMERAEGQVVSDMVLEAAARGERMPELEMLVIIDGMLELLSAAHSHDIVYNDVDAKHLFWNRETYRLKMIDWGNAVFLEGDDSTAQGISRQSDIYQVGELLYFILTGGGRVEVAHSAGDDFRLDFGPDAEHIHSRLQAIVTRSLHPNVKLRYRTIDEFRKELMDYRTPLERERGSMIGRVNERLKRDRSKDELNGLIRALEPAQAMDPGFPQARQVRNEILDRLSDIEVAADLDAARIYLESGNWTRAVSLLDELRSRARGDTAAVIDLLLDWAKLLHDADVRPTPPAVVDAISMVFEGELAPAATLLQTQDDPRDEARRLQWLLAERISSRTPDILLLRPNLYRLDLALAQLSAEDVPVDEARSLLADIWTALDSISSTTDVSLIALRDRYRKIVDQMAAVTTLLEAVNSTYRLPNRKLPLTSLERAMNATMALADNMHVVGKQATGSPRDARAALDASRAIDPSSRAWDAIGQMLDNLYQHLGGYQTYVPSADGSDLDAWLQAAQHDLQPYSERLFDELLVTIIRGLQTAERAWQNYAAAAVNGSRIGSMTALTQATDAVSTVSPTLAGWLNQLRSLINNAQYVERHALFGGLGRALADGWLAYDAGRLADAERLGGQAFEIARNDVERFAARRLRELAENTRGWVERNGISDAKRTQASLAAVEALYTVEESNTRDSFTAQMPSKETYLKAMGKALVDLFARSSTAATRLLFFNYLLLGALDAHEGSLEDAAFWREAAVRTLGDPGAKHTATRVLDDFLARRRDVNSAAALLDSVSSKRSLARLEESRKSLEANPQARMMAAGVYGLREIEAALRDWSDGEFKAAGLKLENASKSIAEVEAQAAVSLTNYRTFLLNLLAGSAELYNLSRNIIQTVDSRPEEPPEALRVAHHRLVDLTVQLVGDPYAATLKQWRDTYDAFLAVYTDRTMRRTARLGRFNELFRAMFIDRHPAYPLYRHWYDLTSSAPEFPAPPTVEPTPRIAEDVPVQPVVAPKAATGSQSKVATSTQSKAVTGTLPKAATRENAVVPPPTMPEVPAPDRDDEPARKRRKGPPWLPIVAAAAVVVVITLVALSGLLNRAATATPVTPIIVTNSTEGAAQSTNAAATTAEPSATSSSGFTMFTAVPSGDSTLSRALATNTAVPTSQTDLGILVPTSADAISVIDATAIPPSATPIPATDVPSTVAPTELPSVPPTAFPTVPPEGLKGKQSLLDVASGLGTQADYSAEQFSKAADSEAWKLGLANDPGGNANAMIIRLPVAMLEQRFGATAASRIDSVEATMALITYVPTLVSGQQVYFGAGLENSADPTKNIGLQVLLAQPGIISLGPRVNSSTQFISQRSVTAVVVRLRLQRDPVSGVVTLFYNDEQIGQPVLFAGPDDPVVPVLFVRGGGVIVNVTDWHVTLR